MGRGDILAAGGKSATFSTGGKSQMEWDWTFMDAKEFQRVYGISKKRYREKSKNDSR